MCAVNGWFDTVEGNFFQNAIKMLEHRLENCVELIFSRLGVDYRD